MRHWQRGEQRSSPRHMTGAAKSAASSEIPTVISWK
jgi:hypothetical protein